jgi:arylsulfatase A-like enzyme
LAKEGFKFDWAFSQAPTTVPSHMSTLTSLYPTVHGCRFDRRLPENRLTLAEYLRERGYGTAGCVDGGFMRRWYGFDQGFERYDDRFKGFASAVNTVLGWLDGGLSDGPFFVLMHTYDIHSPYDPPEPYRSMYTDPNYAGGFNPTSAELTRVRRKADKNPDLGLDLSEDDLKFIVGRYDGGIRYVDGLIGVLLRGLNQRGLLDNTWIVVTADHGEEFGEHGVVLHDKLFNTVARVPLIIRPPGPPQAGVEVDEIVELLDIMPTFLDLAHVAPVDTLEGRSMTGIMKGDTTGWRNLAFSEHEGTVAERSVFSPTLHIIAALDGSERVVYDYRADPMERTPLDDPSRAEEVDELYRILMDWSLAQIQLAMRGEGAAPATIDQQTIDELRSLGYLE